MLRHIEFVGVFLIFIASLCSCKTETIIQNSEKESPFETFYRPPRVLLVNMDDVSPALMDTLCTFLSQNYSFQVNTTSRKFIAKTKNTINTDSALIWLKNLNAYQAEYIVGVSKNRLIRNYTNGKKKKLLGYSELRGHVSVISTFEVSNWKYSEVNFYLRMKKILMHELGHNLGLEHCTGDNICIMHEQAGSVKNLDREEIIYCKNCRMKLYTDSPYTLFY